MDDRGGALDFDEVEYLRWRETAGQHLDDARLLSEAGRAPAAVLHAEPASRCALKALLHGVGTGGLARRHDLVELIERCRLHAGLELEAALRDALADLSSDYQPVRYPDALPGGTPASHYGRTHAEHAVQTATSAITSVDAHWQLLQRTDEDES